MIRHAKEFGLIIGEMDEARARERDRVLRAELHEGRMVTSRQAFIPDLAGGILGGDALSGSLMVQPEVADEDRTRLMDDLTPMAFLYVTDGQEPQAWMSPHAAFWKRLGGERIAFVAPATGGVDGVRAMTETGRIFAGWADARSIRAAIVRPDRYVYAAVTDAQDLADKLQRLAAQLGVSRSGGQHGDAGSR